LRPFLNCELTDFVAEEGSLEVRKRTFAELYTDVAQLAAAMKSVGIQSGDRVVGQSAFNSCSSNDF